MKYVLKREMVINKNLKEVFDFFARPENLVKITPPDLGFEILTPEPIEMKEGQLIDYTVKLMGFPMRWTSLISEYNPPYKFIDVQLKGPYSFWYHIHTFEEINQSETLIRDEVHYAMPFGVIGQIVRKLLVERQLRMIFDYRSKVINDFFQRS